MSMTKRTVSWRAAWCTLVALFVTVRPSKAEGVLAYKFQSWREDDGRIQVDAHYASAEQTLGPDTRLSFMGVIDTITGATPTGEPATTAGGAVPVTTIDDRRHAGNLDLSHQFGRVNLTAGYARSVESDYVSDGWSVNGLIDFNQKATTLRLGYAGTDDAVQVFFQPQRAEKRSSDVIVGVTQVVNALTSVTANLTYGSASGYLADPYKIVSKQVEVLPGVFLPQTFFENRPDGREKWVAFTSINRAVPAVHGAVEGSYRYYHDTFGVSSHMVEAIWFQEFGEHFVLQPSLRFYRQSAADFYRLTLDGTTFTPSTTPAPGGPFYSADYRLSELRSLTYGLKGVWTPTAAWTFDVAVERYVMKGLDGATSASAYPEATVVTVGTRFSW